MISIRFKDFRGNKFGFDIHVPDGSAIPVKKVFDLCSDYLRTLASMSENEFDKFLFSDGSVVIEFDKMTEERER